jgi:N-sulfoglucosamine sulfohydrolase
MIDRVLLRRMFAALGLLCSVGTICCANDRPNILWISCEDISANLACYGDRHAITPNLDRLAGEGVRFTRAFTPAGVCAVVRSSVITGMYAPAIGSQNMRSNIIPPTDVKCFPEYLRAAGYFCTNREKTDYQFDPPPSVWDRQGAKHDDWRERPSKDQPFFSVVNLTVTHESQIRHSEARHAEIIQAIGKKNARDPDKVADTLPAYLPDTPAVRRDWAWYHDNITRMDQMAGELLQKLEEDGLAESTIVVFWSDHGMGMPRGKRWLYDTGTHVPVIVRWPGQIEAGTVREDLVSVIDLPPTMLSIAGVAAPRHLHGRIILGEDSASEPAYLFFHRDRMDEVFETQRAARDRRWKYIRNFEPDKPYSQHLEYMDQMPSMKDWRRLAAEEKLTGGQKNWFAATKPVEELYDTENDPWELENLAEVPQYAERLARMRRATERWQTSIGDTGMLPEAVLMEEMLDGTDRPTVAPPRIIRRDGEISLLSSTEGASIVYRTKASKDSDKWSDWQLYTRSFSGDEALMVQAQACRAGYISSEIVE